MIGINDKANVVVRGISREQRASVRPHSWEAAVWVKML